MVFKNLCVLLWKKVAPALEGLTHTCLDYSLTSFVRTYDIFTIGIRHPLANNLKDFCWFSSDQHLSYKYFQNDMILKMIPSKLFRLFCGCRHEGGNFSYETQGSHYI